MPSVEKVDAVVIGAGVVGLAVARALVHQNREVIVLEAADCIGGGISSRNSEVIHAGIYYPRDSLKARLCRIGKRTLYQYCADYRVPHKRCGKLIVAVSDSEKSALSQIQNRALDNGVDDLEWLAPARVSELEPEIECVGALLSPSTGIIDSHALMLSLQGEVEAGGGVVALKSQVSQLSPAENGITITCGSSGDMVLLANSVVIAAGLGAQAVANNTHGFGRSQIPPLYFCKGNYFGLNGIRPFSTLIYPIPEGHGLGIHATIDLHGSVRFGPDSQWVDQEEYGVDPSRAAKFYEAIRGYYPGLPDGGLSPAYAGIRPKTVSEAGPRQDFQVLGPDVHNLPGLVALFGIESPGLTASLAIANYVCQLLPQA